MNKLLPKPTDSELSILRVLWERGPSTVREIHDVLGSGTGYTTVLKLLQIMTEKQLVTRDESNRTHVYEPAVSEEKTQRQLVGELMEKAFGGSAEKLVLQALASKKTSSKELKQIRKLLEQMEGK